MTHKPEDENVLWPENGINRTFFCHLCEGKVELVTVVQASRVCKVSRKTIYNWIAKDQLHTFETAGGQIRICLGSLIHPYEGGQK